VVGTPPRDPERNELNEKPRRRDEQRSKYMMVGRNPASPFGKAAEKASLKVVNYRRGGEGRTVGRMSRREKELGMREATGERAKNRTNSNLGERQDKRAGRNSGENGRTIAIISKSGSRSSSRLACYHNVDLE
jgi:hypothetical protein